MILQIKKSGLRLLFMNDLGKDSSIVGFQDSVCGLSFLNSQLPAQVRKKKIHVPVKEYTDSVNYRVNL